MDSAETVRRRFKAGLDADASRKKREEIHVELRKSKRDEQIRKRRTALGGGEITKLKDETEFGVSEGGLGVDSFMGDRLRQIPGLIAGCNSGDPNAELESTRAFRKLLSIERNPPIQQVIDCGIVPKFVQFLTRRDNPNLMFEAAWALTNIASGTQEHTRTVIESGASPLLIELLKDPWEDIREQAVWALGNIAGDSAQCRDMLLAQGIMEPLLAICQPTSKITTLRNATWTLSNLCRGKPQPAFELIAPSLPVLGNLLFAKDDEVLVDACWALSYISDDNGPENAKISAVIRAGVCKRLVELLLHKSNQVKTPALRTIGNIVTGDDLQTQVVINCSGLQGLRALLDNDKRSIRKEACWTISNITAGNKEQIQQVINANVFPSLISLLRAGDFDVQKEAAWAVSNATSGGTPEQIRYLVSQACIPPLCDILTCQDAKIVQVCLEALENILKIGHADSMTSGSGVNVCAQFIEECGGLDKLEAIQHHENLEVYHKAASILRKFFDADEEGNLDFAPQVSADQSSYTFGTNAPQGGFNF